MPVKLFANVIAFVCEPLHTVWLLIGATLMFVGQGAMVATTARRVALTQPVELFLAWA